MWKNWDTASQITLFDWHNHIAANGHASSADNNISILTAGGAPPHILPLRKELATRLAGGLVFRINGQSDTEKRLTLERFANRRSFHCRRKFAIYYSPPAARHRRPDIGA